MAVHSVVKLSGLSPGMRLDAEHYKPEYLQQEAAMGARKTTPLQDVATISDGNHVSIGPKSSVTKASATYVDKIWATFSSLTPTPSTSRKWFTTACHARTCSRAMYWSGSWEQ